MIKNGIAHKHAFAFWRVACRFSLPWMCALKMKGKVELNGNVDDMQMLYPNTIGSAPNTAKRLLRARFHTASFLLFGVC